MRVFITVDGEQVEVTTRGAADLPGLYAQWLADADAVRTERNPTRRERIVVRMEQTEDITEAIEAALAAREY